MKDAARALAQGDALLPDVIAAVAAEVPVAGVTVQESAGSVEPGATATWKISFHGAVCGALAAQVIAGDGNAVAPVTAGLMPVAQCQRVDLLPGIPPERRAFPVLAQVGSAVARTGKILATTAAKPARIAGRAAEVSDDPDLRLNAACAPVSHWQTNLH